MSVTGEFDADTSAYVKQFNSDVGLSGIGDTVNQSTWATLTTHDKLPDWVAIDDLITEAKDFGTGPALKKGNKGLWVKILQDTINGCDYGPLKVDGIFGRKTEKAIKAFQQTENLAQSGQANADTWVALHKAPKLPRWSPRSLIAPLISHGGFDRQLFLQFAEQELGQNLYWKDDQETRKYTQPFEPEFGKGRFPWCAANLLWCLNNFDGKGGLKLPIRIPGQQYTLALVEQWQHWTQALGYYIDNDGTNQPQPGDIILFDWNQRDIDQIDKDWENHIGVFLRMNGNKFVCAEGNAESTSES